ncbi:hypothetical protein, partial [Porphyromonas endodontalis]|uniref:hypothetical protein n=1 Tax=Porphyromonas endodontalis TaxID=28124 RepID=UPI0026F04F62
RGLKMGIINPRAKLLFSCRRRGEGPGQGIWWSRNKYLSLPIVRPRFVFLLFPPSNGSIAMLQISGDFQIQGLGVSFLLLSLALGVE